jgi:uncharacterized protein
VIYTLPAMAALWLLRQPGFKFAQMWYGGDPEAERRQLAMILCRFVITALMITFFTAQVFPHKLFCFPSQKTWLWLAIFILYPFFSAYPQELIYRALFFKRYRGLFSKPWLLIIASATAFSWMHMIFRNPWAMSFTWVGGLFFSQTYARTHSMRLVCLEHALYGNLIFTIGLGEFFHHTRISPF